MKHRHYDLITAFAEDSTLRFQQWYGGEWNDCATDIIWDETYTLRIKPTVEVKHANYDVLMAFANDSSVKIQRYNSSTDMWIDQDDYHIIPRCVYRVKPEEIKPGSFVKAKSESLHGPFIVLVNKVSKPIFSGVIVNSENPFFPNGSYQDQFDITEFEVTSNPLEF